MLSELYEIATLLEQAGVSLTGVGSELMPYSKAPLLVAYLTFEGSVERMEIQRNLSGPGKIAPNNQASFPVVALRVPKTELTGINEDHVKRNQLAGHLSNSEFFLPGIRSALRSVQNVLQYLRPESELSEFAKVVSSILPEQWAMLLSNHIPKLIRDVSGDDLEYLVRALDIGIGFQLFFVPSDYPELVLTRSKLESGMNQVGVKQNLQNKDVLGGKGPVDQMLRFSFPNHPIATPIIARSADFRALRRYDKPLISLSKETIDRFRSTLAFLLADERRGITWEFVSRRKQQRDVMIVVGDPNKGQQFLELFRAHAGIENEVYENTSRRLLAGDPDVPLKIMFLTSPQKMAIRFENYKTFSALALANAIRRWSRDLETLEPIRDVISPLTPSRAMEVLTRRWVDSSSEVRERTLRKVSRMVSVPADLLWVDEKRAPLVASSILNGLNIFVWCIASELRHKGLKSLHLRSEIRETTSLLTFAARRAGWIWSMPHPSYELGKALATGDVLDAAFQRIRNNAISTGKLAGASELWRAKKHPIGALDRVLKRLRPANRSASRLLYEKRKLSKHEASVVAASSYLRRLSVDLQLRSFPLDRVEHEAMLFIGFQADVLYTASRQAKAKHYQKNDSSEEALRSADRSSDEIESERRS